MKLRTNKIKTIIIFVSTLVFGVTALAISWRLQQEKQITEEEAAAAGWEGSKYWHSMYYCNYSDGACSSGHNTYYSSINANAVYAPCTSYQFDNNGEFSTRVMGADPNRQAAICRGGYNHYCAGLCWFPNSGPNSSLECKSVTNRNLAYYTDSGQFDFASCASCKNIEIIGQPNDSKITVKAFSRNLIPVIVGNNSKPYLHKEKSKTEFRFRILSSDGSVIKEEIINSSHPKWGDVHCSLTQNDPTDQDLGDRIEWTTAKNPGHKIYDCEITFTLNLSEPLIAGNYTVEVSSRMPKVDGPRQPGYDHVYWRHPDMVLTKSAGNINYDFNSVYLDSIGVTGTPTYRQVYNNSTVSGGYYDFSSDSNNTCMRQFEILPSFGEPEVDCISKTADPSEGVKVGDTVTYTVEYSSLDIEGNVTITDTLDPHLSFGEFTEPSSGCSESSGEISCTLPGNVSGNVIYTATVESEGTISNTATVSSGELSDLTDCEADFRAMGPDAKCLSKTISTEGVSEDPVVDPGQEVSFTINWENGPIAGDILVYDEVPNGFENVTVTSPSSGCSVSGNTVHCSITALANATGSVTVTATAKSNVRDLETTNTAAVRVDTDGDGTADDRNDAENICSTGTTVSEANAVCVSKAASPEGTVSPGDEVSYTITYTVERGPADVSITETLPDHLTLLTANGYTWCDTGETGDQCNKDYGTQYTNSLCEYDSGTRVLSCTVTESDTGTFNNIIVFDTQINETDIPIDGTTIANTVTIGTGTGEGESECSETVTVTHEPPFCIVTNPNVMIIRQQDIASTSIELTTRGDLGTHENLEFKWTATGGTLSSTEWHTASGTPGDPTDGEVTDTITWAPPADAVDTDTYDIKAYVRPLGSTDETGISADECEATSTITALDLSCLYLVPNDPVGPFPFDMTFKADIGGDEGAAFTYDLDFGDESTHYTGNDTVAAGTTIELPYIPPQSSPHTYDSTTPITYSPSLTVTNTETGEVSICPTVLAGTTQSSWSIVKDSDVDTCVVANSTVAYSIIVKNTGDYSADLEEVRDTIDPKIDTATITNIRECDANGLNCTTYNKADVLSGRTITWPGRTFTAGESRKYMYNVTVSTAGDYYNIAEAVPTTGETMRDDETFPTCTGKSGPKTGVLSSAAYAMIFASILGAFGVYTYQTRTGAQVVANVIGKVRRTVWKKTNRKKAFERNSIRSSKKKT